MPVCKVNIKWSKEKYSDVDCDTDQSPLMFKATVYSLTGVPVERQRVMVKGGTLNDENWNNLKVENGCTIMVVGTAEEKTIEPPAERVKFIEDMDDSQLAKALHLPSGLTNLGNTCYMNSTIQCLLSIPELVDALKILKSETNPILGLPFQLHMVCSNLERSETFTPYIFLHSLHQTFPQFSTKGEHGELQQQDANEFWVEMVKTLQQVVALPPSIKEHYPTSNSNFEENGFVDAFMRGRMEVTLTCTDEAGKEEPPVNNTEFFYQLSCFIDKDVKFLQTGIRNGFEGTLTKHSTLLQRDALYKKTAVLSRLPAYLSIQFVRFCYKEKENINAKVLRDVKFPLLLDLYDFCSEDLRTKLVPMREKFKLEEERKLELERAKKNKALVEQVGNTSNETSDDTPVKYAPYSFPDDIGSNNSGYYMLQAVLTHQGRSSNSGHYVAWVLNKKDEWIKFDDDEVSVVQADDILRLSGGGDWHCAYVLLYGPRKLEIV